MSPEAELTAALDAAPGPVTLWWRDDDAGRDHPRLASLLALAGRRAAPIALAVVPDWLEEPCAERILASPMATVLQHGIAHANHGLLPGKKVELGGWAEHGMLAASLARRREYLATTFGGRFLPALVPPWNRIAPELVPMLPAAGFSGLSVFGPRRKSASAPGVRLVNTHLDLVAWGEGTRSFTFEELAPQLATLVAAHADEPIGILSHHLVMDEAAFATLDRLLALVQDHRQGRLATIETLFGEG
jgi:hypothetical protein